MNTKNSVLEAIRQRRSIRKYTEDEITREHLLAILEAGRWAPSGLNNQPWRFMVVTPGDPRHEDIAACTKYEKIALSARALIVVLLDKDRMYSPIKDHQSSGAVIQNMLLAAHSLGLGGVWLGEILNREDEVLGILGLEPNNYELQAVLALGHPDQKGGSKRLELHDLLLEEF